MANKYYFKVGEVKPQYKRCVAHFVRVHNMVNDSYIIDAVCRRHRPAWVSYSHGTWVQ